MLALSVARTRGCFCCGRCAGCTSAAGSGTNRSGKSHQNHFAPRLTCRAGIVPTILLHFLRPWRSLMPRAHGKGLFLQSFCISSVPGGQLRTTPWQGLFPTSLCISAIDGGQMEDDCRDAGGRATQGVVAEVEPCWEQRSRSGLRPAPKSRAGNLGFRLPQGVRRRHILVPTDGRRLAALRFPCSRFRIPLGDVISARTTA